MEFEPKMGEEMLRSSAIAAILAVGWSAAALAEPDPLEPNWSEAQAIWVAKIRGLPVGFVTASSEAPGVVGPVESDLRLLLRVGSNPVVYHAQSRWEGKESAWELKVSTEYLARSGVLEPESITWRYLDGKIQKEGVTNFVPISKILGGVGRAVVDSQPWTSGSALLLRSPSAQDKSDFRVFSPFSGEFFSSKELDASWEPDGWARALSVPLGEGLKLELRRESKDSAKALLGEIKRAPVDPQWFTSEARFSADLSELRSSSDSCISFSENAEKEIKRRSPGIPYLLHRRLVNLRSLCAGIRNAIFRAEAEKYNQERTLKALVEEIRLQERESRRELPQAFAASPEWSVFSREDLLSQTIRVASYFVRRGRAEAMAQLSVEQERKVNLDLRVYASLLEQRAVLRGVMKMKESAVETRIEVLTEGEKPSSYQVRAFDFLNAPDPVALVRSVCQREKGRVGLDLGGSSVQVVRSDLFRGVWDEPSRMQLAPDFLLRAFSIPECTALSLAVPKRLEAEAKAAAERFRHDILQTENHFQVSNGKFTKFRILPGAYGLTLSSYVNGAKIGEQDFRVSEKGKESLSLSFK